jgi:hypothetical protein
MLTQAKSVSKQISLNLQPKSPFERHILKCCAAPEYELRSWLKAVLTKAGFRLIEDTYKTDRVNKNKRYENVHNLVAIRGNPDVCLVAHTDVCREHSEKSNRSYGASNDTHEEYSKWLGRKVAKEEFETAKATALKEAEYRVTPVIKEIEHEGQLRRVIQDKLCKFQVGGDDRLGVAINTWIALNTGYDMGLYFPTDEEIGLKSARACEIKELKDFDLLVQVDRGNHSRELVIKIGSEVLCNIETQFRLIDIAYQMGLPRVPVTGLSTDVAALKGRGMCKNAVNMTCGYHNSFGSDPTEYIELGEAWDTMLYVSEIVKNYYLHGRCEEVGQLEEAGPNRGKR